MNTILKDQTTTVKAWTHPKTGEIRYYINCSRMNLTRSAKLYVVEKHRKESFLKEGFEPHFNFKYQQDLMRHRDFAGSTRPHDIAWSIVEDAFNRGVTIEDIKKLAS